MKQAITEQWQTNGVLHSHSFSKSMRLLNANEFQRVFDDAPLRTSHQYFLLLARRNSFKLPRLGLVIAKKNIRLAVDRNRMKRLIRETFRAKQQHLVGIDVIVLARKGMNNLPNALLVEQLNSQWQRLIRRIEKDKSEQVPVVESSSILPTSETRCTSFDASSDTGS